MRRLIVMLTGYFQQKQGKFWDKCKIIKNIENVLIFTGLNQQALSSLSVCTRLSLNWVSLRSFLVEFSWQLCCTDCIAVLYWCQPGKLDTDNTDSTEHWTKQAVLLWGQTHFVFIQIHYSLSARHLGQHSIVVWPFSRKEPLREHQLTDHPLYCL